jgi:hypothetical protein
VTYLMCAAAVTEIDRALFLASDRLIQNLAGPWRPFRSAPDFLETCRAWLNRLVKSARLGQWPTRQALEAVKQRL